MQTQANFKVTCYYITTLTQLYFHKLVTYTIKTVDTIVCESHHNHYQFWKLLKSGGTELNSTNSDRKNPQVHKI